MNECKFCKDYEKAIRTKNKYVIQPDHKRNLSVGLVQTDIYGTTSTSFNIDTYDIKYCPMCGKELKGGE